MNKTINLTLAILATVFITISFSACSSNDDDNDKLDDRSVYENTDNLLIGQWFYHPYDGYSFVFNNDGTYKVLVSGGEHISLRGDWKLNGNQLYMRSHRDKEINKPWDITTIQIDKTMLIIEIPEESGYVIMVKDGYKESHYNSMIFGEWKNGNKKLDFYLNGTYTIQTEVGNQIYDSRSGGFIIFDDIIYLARNTEQPPIYHGRRIISLDNRTLQWVNGDNVEIYTKVQ